MTYKFWDLLVKMTLREQPTCTESCSIITSPLFLSDGQVVRSAVFLSVRSAAGFEGCSMVPSIYPMETLHNSLSLKQVDEFLNTVCESSSEAHAKTMKGRLV